MIRLACCAIATVMPSALTGCATVRTPVWRSGSRTSPSSNGSGSLATISPSRKRSPVKAIAARTSPGRSVTVMAVAVGGAAAAEAGSAADGEQHGGGEGGAHGARRYALDRRQDDTEGQSPQVTVTLGDCPLSVTGASDAARR